MVRLKAIFRGKNFCGTAIICEKILRLYGKWYMFLQLCRVTCPLSFLCVRVCVSSRPSWTSSNQSRDFWPSTASAALTSSNWRNIPFTMIPALSSIQFVVSKFATHIVCQNCEQLTCHNSIIVKQCMDAWHTLCGTVVYTAVVQSSSLMGSNFQVSVSNRITSSKA